MVLFIEYPKCSTCKKAKKWLVDNNIDFTDRDIVNNTPNIEEIKDFVKKSGMDIKKFFNTSGMLYREMELKEKLNYMSDEEKFKLLSSNGVLIKRPLLVGDNFVCAGFKEEKYEEYLK